MKKLSVVEEKNRLIEQNLLDAGFVISKKLIYANYGMGSLKISRIFAIYVDDTNKNIAFVNTFLVREVKTKIKVCSYRDIVDFEIKEDGKTVISGKTGNALAGAVLFGGVGAVVGAAGRRTAVEKCVSKDLIVYINAIDEPILTFNIFNNVYPLDAVNSSDVVELSGVFTYVKNHADDLGGNSFDISRFFELEDSNLNVVEKDNKKRSNKKKYNSNERDKWITFVLCLLFGTLGVHKFYEKKIGWGVLYLFTMGLFEIGVIVDLIKILLKKKRFYKIS